MKNRFVGIALVTVLCAAAGGSLFAGGLTYSEQAKRIKVGVLLTVGQDMDPLKRPNPYTFFVMDRREDIKPSGWDLYNPFAPSHVTADIVARWGNAYQIGEPIDKSMGCYWEVGIAEISPEDLAQYDVLLLSGYMNPATNAGIITFNNREREKLRKFVDNGGVLWLEYRGVGPNTDRWETRLNVPTFFIQELQFSGGGAGAGVEAIIPVDARAHSLVNRPFYLTPKDINQLGGYDLRDRIGKEYIAITSPSEADLTLKPIVKRGVNVVLAAAQYGSGSVVVSADGIGQAISEPVGLGMKPNKDYNGRCGVALFGAHPEDLKMACNIISIGSEHTTYHKNARRTGYSFAEIGAPLVSLWNYLPGLKRNLGRPPNLSDGSAAILDDMIFYVGDGKIDPTSGNGKMTDGHYVLHALDLSPIRDRNGDGDPDDGVPNGMGSPYDVLWEAEIREPCSPPTVAYAPYASKGIVPAVFIVTRSGKVFEFDASSGIASGNVTTPEELFKAPNALKPFDATALTGIPSPTYAGGVLYAGDGDGFIHAHNLLSGTGWTHPQVNLPHINGISNAPVFGSFYDPTSGATEQVVYHSTRAKPNQANGCIRAYPIKSCNEVLWQKNPEQDPSLYKVRSANTWIDTTPGTWKLYYTQDLSISPQEIPPANITVVNPGAFQIVPRAFYDGLVGPLGVTILADYQLDYTNEGSTPPFRQIPIEMPANVQQGYTVGVTGSPAAGKNDTLYFGTENGCFYAAKEMGRGFTAATTAYPPLCVKWRWYLGDPPVSSALGITIANPMTETEIVGSPVVVGDMVYFAMNHRLTTQGYILAFKADPVFSIKLKNKIRPGTQVTVRQTDTLRDKTQFVDFSGASSVDSDRAAATLPFVVDYDSGKITFINFRPRNFNGELSSSQDMIVIYTPDLQAQTGQQPQNPVPISEPHAAFARGTPDNWNNLAWFVRLRDLRGQALVVSSSPVVMGDVMYMGCSNGMLASLDLEKTIQIPVSGLEKPPTYLWAESVMNDPHPPGDPALAVLATVAGSHGMLAVTTSEGLSVLYNPVSLVADSNRLLEIDAAGRVMWTCDSTSGFASTWAVSGSSGATAGPAHGAVDVPFNRPSVARRTPQGGIVVADTGNNRIVYIDKGGGQMWQVTDFVEPDPRMFPSGSRPIPPLLAEGSSLELDKPTDVTAWMTIEADDYDDSNSPVHPVFHFLIADSGNYRVLEIASRYDPRVNAYRNVLLKVSKNLEEGKRYRYMTARPIAYGPIGTYPNAPTVPTLIACAVSNQDARQADLGGAGGALVKLDWTNGAPSAPINAIPLDNPAGGKQLVNPAFYTRQFVSSMTDYAEIAIDARGVHIARTQMDASGNKVTTIGSYLISDHADAVVNPLTGMVVGVYPKPLAPSYAQFLPNGHVLVTNKATGFEHHWNMGMSRVDKGPFSGEIFEIVFDVTTPPVNGIYKYVLVPGTSIPNLSNPLIKSPAVLHQPSSAERLLY